MIATSPVSDNAENPGTHNALEQRNFHLLLHSFSLTHTQNFYRFFHEIFLGVCELGKYTWISFSDIRIGGYRRIAFHCPWISFSNQKNQVQLMTRQNRQSGSSNYSNHSRLLYRDVPNEQAPIKPEGNLLPQPDRFSVVQNVTWSGNSIVLCMSLA